MKLYFAGLCDPQLITEETRVLLSYLDKEQIVQVGKPLFLDSGAFSMFTRGKQIDINEYVDYIKAELPRFEIYASLDVIGDWKASRKNTEYMESKGLKPLPVFHYGGPLKELQYLVDKYDYFALGGLVPLSKNRAKLQQWLDYCFTHIKPLKKVHAFGITGQSLTRYPLYSADSTSWLINSSFRKTCEHKQGVVSVLYKESHLAPTSKNYKSHIFDDVEIRRHAIEEYIKLEKYITRLWEKRGIVWED